MSLPVLWHQSGQGQAYAMSLPVLVANLGSGVSAEYSNAQVLAIAAVARDCSFA